MILEPPSGLKPETFRCVIKKEHHLRSLIALLKDGKITADGKVRIGRLLAGRIFDDIEQYENAPAYLKRNIERTVSPVIKTQGDNEWNIIPEVREAIDLLSEYGAKGGKQSLEEYASTPSFVRPDWSDAAIDIAKTLRQSPNKVSSAFKTYANEYANAKTGGGLFGASTQEQAFDAAFGEGETLQMAAGDGKGVGFPDAAIKTEIKRFGKEVDGALNKSLPVNVVPEVLSMAPPILVRLGVNEDSIFIPQSVIRKAEARPTSEESIAHDVAPEALKQLPAELNDPVMVFESLRDPKALVVITDLKNRQGLPVAAVVKFDATLEHETVNLIPTVTDKKGNIFIKDWASKRKAKYYNKEKGRTFLELIGLPLSEVEETILSTDNILTEADFVNEGPLQMAAYSRVMPRDLFNEAKVLSMHLKFIDDYNNGRLPEGFEISVEGRSPDVGLSDDGELYLPNVQIYFQGESVTLSTTYNAGKDSKFPLSISSEEHDVWSVPVYDGNGRLDEEFTGSFGDRLVKPRRAVEKPETWERASEFYKQLGVVGLWEADRMLPASFTFDLHDPDAGFQLDLSGDTILSQNLDARFDGDAVTFYMERDGVLRFESESGEGGRVLEGREKSEEFKALIERHEGETLQMAAGKDAAAQRNDWAAKVGAIFAGRIKSGSHIIMDRTPTILRHFGLPAKAIYTTVDVVEKLKGDHGLNQRQVTDLFDDIIDPIMLFDSSTVDRSKVIVTNLKDYKGESIIVAIKPNGQVTLETPKGRKNETANILTSSYGKTNKALQYWIDDDLLLYRNTEKGKGRWHGLQRLQLPSSLSRRSPSKRKILTQDDFVNEGPLFQKASDADTFYSQVERVIEQKMRIQEFRRTSSNDTGIDLSSILISLSGWDADNDIPLAVPQKQAFGQCCCVIYPFLTDSDRFLLCHDVRKDEEAKR